jgi:hypothetical protein
VGVEQSTPMRYHHSYCCFTYSIRWNKYIILRRSPYGLLFAYSMHVFLFNVWIVVASVSNKLLPLLLAPIAVVPSRVRLCVGVLVAAGVEI